MQNNEIRPLFHTTYKINSKWFNDLNMTPNTINLEENIGEKLINIGVGDDLLDTMPDLQTTEAKIHKWDYMKQTLLYSGRDSWQDEKKA